LFTFAAIKMTIMENLINWFEIPASDFERAIQFYKTILKIEITELDMYGTKMGMFASDGQNISGAIVEGEGYSPSDSGVLVYLNGGEDLQVILSRVESIGGNILMPKTQISPDMGYFAIFLDSEGNKMALHSMN
jgi:predicted enzyme related to lactoylglutathione lyase